MSAVEKQTDAAYIREVIAAIEGPRPARRSDVLAELSRLGASPAQLMAAGPPLSVARTIQRRADAAHVLMLLQRLAGR